MVRKKRLKVICFNIFNLLDGTAIKFNTLNALPLEDWNGQALSFHFATVNSTALLAEIYEPEKPLYIKIVEGHTIELSYSGGTLVAHSQARYGKEFFLLMKS